VKQRQANWAEIGHLILSIHIPNIIQHISSFYLINEQEIWIVTEFFEGGTLNILSHGSRVDECHISYISYQILSALKFLHDHNILHRDMKSTNIMISPKGKIKLIDFGLSISVSEGGRRKMAGSPYWMPPEMIIGNEYTLSADIWSFGVCCFELVLANPPYYHSPFECMYVAATKGFHDIIPQDISVVFRDFLSHCLEYDPKERYTANDLLNHPFVKHKNLSEEDYDNLQMILLDHFVENSLETFGLT